MNKSLDILKFQLRKKDKNILSRLEVKPFVKPSDIAKDDSTISLTKRVGGQILQMYSMHTKEVVVEDNSKYYYLVSSQYPIESSIEYSRTKIKNISFKVNYYRTQLNLKDNIHSSYVVADFLLKKTITRTYRVLAEKFYSSNFSVSGFDMPLIINRKYYPIIPDEYSSLGYSINSVKVINYPRLNKSVFENSKTNIISFNFKVV